MLALREFTVAELAARAEVPHATVRTVMHRMQGDVDVVGVEESGRRGGQPRRYRLKEQAVGRLMDELRDVEQKIVTVTLPVIPAAVAGLGSRHDEAHGDGDVVNDPPPEVALAKAILLEELPDLPPGEDRYWRLTLAQSAIQDASEALLQLPRNDKQRRQGEWVLGCLEFLAQLALTEDALYKRPLAAVVSSVRSVEDTLKSLLSTDDAELEGWIKSLRERVVESPTARVLIDAVPELIGVNPRAEEWRSRSRLVVLLDIAQGGARGANDRVEHLLRGHEVDVRRFSFDFMAERLLHNRAGTEDAEPLFRRIDEHIGATFFNPVWVLSVDASDQPEAHDAIEHASHLTAGVGELFVVAERFDPELNNNVHAHYGHFLPTQGLTDQAVLGAFGFTEPPMRTTAHHCGPRAREGLGVDCGRNP